VTSGGMQQQLVDERAQQSFRPTATAPTKNVTERRASVADSEGRGGGGVPPIGHRIFFSKPHFSSYKTRKYSPLCSFAIYDDTVSHSPSPTHSPWFKISGSATQRRQTIGGSSSRLSHVQNCAVAQNCALQ